MAGPTWGLLAAGAMAGLLAACGASPPAGPAAETAPAAGRLTLQLQAVPDLKPVPATLTTRDMADARARLQGVLTRLTVKAGDTVRRGQVIGFVRDDQIGLQTGAFAAQAQAAAAQAARAQADLVRTRDLYAHGVYAQARLDQVVAESRAADAQLRAAQDQRAASAALAAEGAIVAPADGKVLTADVPAGSVVTPGQSVARITAGPLVVRVELPEAEAAALKVGDTVALEPADLGGAARQGVVTQVYPDVADGQVQADVTAPGLPADLIGRRVRAEITVGVRQALVVPRLYIVTRDGVDYARLVAADGTVSEMPVETAAGPTPDTLEVLSGLRAGDVLTPATPPAARSAAP
jgi:RND family efflux transporter MFP subunit